LPQRDAAAGESSGSLIMLWFFDRDPHPMSGVMPQLTLN